MQQEQVKQPAISHGRGHAWYYALYLWVATWIMRQLVHRFSGDGLHFSKRIRVSTPGLGRGSVSCSVCLPRGEHPRSLPVLIVLEGGGFVLGEPNDGEQQSRMISDRVKTVVISIDYAKSPRFPYPHALLQAYEVLKWSLSIEATREFGIEIDSSRVAIMGNSAGGNLAAALTLLCAFETGPPSIFRQGLPPTFRQVSQVLLYPSLALNASYGSRFMSSEKDVQDQSLPVWVATAMEESYLPPYIDKEQIFITPLSANGDLLRSLARRLPHTAFALAGLDCLKLEAHAYAGQLREAGVSVAMKEFEGANHGFTHYKSGNRGFRKNDVEGAWDFVIQTLEKHFQE
ncbi:alpha/beta hydrolase fold-domain-containing protein [Xylariaceae sp. FL0016]|nr:alpha/beta hydrolase fold-domain-containing protein [Xylariaceae sp. FL0016]